MFQRLVNHNDDIRRLVEKGYAVAFDSGYLIVRDIPYLDSHGQLQIGAIVTKLEFIDQWRVIQNDHQIFFAGGIPHNIDLTPIPNLGGGVAQLALGETSEDVIVQRSFSNKPIATGKFNDFYEKIDSYVSIISGPALQLYNDTTPLTYRFQEKIETESVFKIYDTLTSRAEITDLSAKFKDDIIAIIGLGGTGAYIMDFLVKTPVREIRAFDNDPFHIHNAFRSPGKVDNSEFGNSKADVYYSRYNNFRTGISVKAKLIDSSCQEELSDVTFAFVCVDKGPSRSGIFDLLLSKGIPFIDVGMGCKRRNHALSGMIRTTYYSSDDGQKVSDKGLAPFQDAKDDLYRTNIQISELNALNACLAVIKFKQLRGFYFEEIPYFHFMFTIGDLKIVGERDANED